MAEDQNKDPQLPKPQIKASTEKPSIAKELGSYVMEEYIVPKTKDIMHDAFAGMFSMLSDAVQGALNKAFYGEDNGYRVQKKSNNQSTSYNSFYTSAQSSRSNTYSTNRIAQRSSTEVKIIFVDTEEEAQSLAEFMRSNILDYGKVKVSDLYQSLTPKVNVSFQDFKFGWVNPNEIGYHKVFSGEHRNQWQLDLPKPIDVTNI